MSLSMTGCVIFWLECNKCYPVFVKEWINTEKRKTLQYRGQNWSEREEKKDKMKLDHENVQQHTAVVFNRLIFNCLSVVHHKSRMY